MKTTIQVSKEIEVTHILIDVPVEYGEEDIPNDFPLRNGDHWNALVNIDTGKIVDWPADAGAQEIYMKVCDRGTYVLYSSEEKIATREEDYVPNAVVPGEWGDYIELKIAADGTITNWPKKPDVSAFFNND